MNALRPRGVLAERPAPAPAPTLTRHRAERGPPTLSTRGGAAERSWVTLPTEVPVGALDVRGVSDELGQPLGDARRELRLDPHAAR